MKILSIKTDSNERAIAVQKAEDLLRDLSVKYDMSMKFFEPNSEGIRLATKVLNYAIECGLDLEKYQERVYLLAKMHLTGIIMIRNVHLKSNVDNYEYESLFNPAISRDRRKNSLFTACKPFNTAKR